jgi:hypothetical protein
MLAQIRVAITNIAGACDIILGIGAPVNNTPMLDLWSYKVHGSFIST